MFMIIYLILWTFLKTGIKNSNFRQKESFRMVDSCNAEWMKSENSVVKSEIWKYAAFLLVLVKSLSRPYLAKFIKLGFGN